MSATDVLLSAPSAALERGGVSAEELDSLYEAADNPLPPLPPPSLLHLTTSSPSSPAISTPNSCPPPPLKLPPPLVDYVCLFSHELHPFEHTCEVDFLSPTPVLKGELTFCIPSPSHPALSASIPLPDCLEHFVYPTGILLHPSPPPPLSHSFVLTLSSGERLYGYSHTVHLPVSSAVLSVLRMQTANRLMQEPHLVYAGHSLPTVLYAPHSVCLLTRHPFSSAYSQLLEKAVQLAGLAPAAAVDTATGLYAALHTERPRTQAISPQCTAAHSRALSQSSTALSPNNASPSSSSPSSSSPGSPSSTRLTRPVSVSVSAQPSSSTSSSSSLLSSLSPVAASVASYTSSLLPSLPLALPSWPWSGCPFIEPASLSLLFLHLSPFTILTLLNLLLSETSVVLTSSSIHILTPLIEALTSLLHPLRWPYIYIPLLPLSLADFFDAPQPFIIGAPASVVELLPEDGAAAMAVVDCDRDEVSMRGGSGRGGAVAAGGLPWPLSWRLWEAMWGIFPAWGLLHLEEDRKAPSGLPPSALCRVVLEEEQDRERRERKGAGGAVLSRLQRRRRRDPCSFASLEPRYRKAIQSLRTCRTLHSGTEGEDDDEAARPQGEALDEEQDGAEGGGSLFDLSSEVEGGEAASAAVSPMQKSTGEDALSPLSPLLPVFLPPSSPCSGFLPSPPSPSTLPAPTTAWVRASPPSAPLAPTPSPAEPPALTSSMSYAAEAGELPAVTPLSAHPGLSSSRSFVGPTPRPRRSLHPSQLSPPTHSSPPSQPRPPPFRASRSLSPSPPSPSPSPPSPLLPSTLDPLYDDACWSSLYNSDGLLTLSSSRARRLRLCFLSAFVSLLRPYRRCIRSPAPGFNGGVEELFDAAQFVEASHPDYQPFLRGFVDSQLMKYFLQDREMPQGGGEGSAVEAGGASGVHARALSQPSSTLSPQSSSSPPSPFSPSFSPSSSISPPSPQPSPVPHPLSSPAASPDYFDSLVAASTLRHSQRHSRLLSTPLSSVLYSLGHRVPMWKERYFELAQGGMSVRMFSVSEQLEEVERRYRALREDWGKRMRTSIRATPNPARGFGRGGGPSNAASVKEEEEEEGEVDGEGKADDVVLKASLDRVGEQREALRLRLHKGTIRLEAGHTSLSIPDDRRSCATPFAFELAVREKKWLLCAVDAETRDRWLACIKARVGRFLEAKAEGHSHASYAESGLQQQLRLLRDEQMRLFEAHITHKVAKLIRDKGPHTAQPHSLPLFTSSHTRRSLSSKPTPLPSPHPPSISPGLFSSSSQATLSRALLCAEMMLRHLDIRERQWRLRSYPSCFVGSDCIAWMLSVGLVADAKAGVEVGSVLIASRVIRHVGDHAVFRGDESLYQFILHAQPLDSSAAASPSTATSTPASLVTTPSHSSRAHSGLPTSEVRHPTPLSFTHPTPEDELILSSLASSLHIRTHYTGLFHTPHADTWKGSDALDWLVDSGVMRGEDDGLRWVRRMIRMGEVEVVEGNSSALKGVAGLYRFRRADKDGADRRRRTVEGVQEEKEREDEALDEERISREEEAQRKARAELERGGLTASDASPIGSVRHLQAPSRAC